MIIYKMPVNAQWQVWTDTDLLRWDKGTSDEKIYAQQLTALYEVYERNRIAFFLAHGQGKDFLNDWEHSVKLMRAPNQVGKTMSLLAWVCLRSCILDPNWPCFTEHGIKYRKYPHEGRAGLGSYMLMHMRRNIWPKLQELMPVDDLREYSPHWHPKDSRKKVKEPSWLHNASVKLASGLSLDFYVYGQPGSAAESCTYQWWALDEQVSEHFFDGAYARGTGVPDFAAAIAYTPHKVPGWASSGAGTWLHRLDRGTDTKGLNYKVYTIGMKDVPDAIIAPEKKKEYYNKYIIAPRKTGNQKAIQAGRSRWFGEYEASEGLVYDNWLPWLHVIDPIVIPEQWPRVRSCDPGRVEPFCCLRCAISPWDDMILYDTYYETGYGMEENIRRIIERCGNKREKVDRITDENGNARIIWEEVCSGETYQFSVIDPRTFASDSDYEGLTVGQIIADFGLDCVAGSGMHNERAVMIVKEWLEIKPDHKHLLINMGLTKEILDKEGQPLNGAPKFYVLNTPNNKAFISEIENYVNKATGDRERPVNKDDHAMTAWKYLCLQEPHYIGPPKPREEWYQSKGIRNKYTGRVSGGKYFS